LVNTEIIAMAKEGKPDEPKRGRPAGRKQDKQLQLRVDAQFLRSVDNFRRREPDAPSRTEAIRRMIGLAEEGLAKAKRRGRDV
jgi:hypothetical protein